MGEAEKGVSRRRCCWGFEEGKERKEGEVGGATPRNPFPRASNNQEDVERSNLRSGFAPILQPQRQHGCPAEAETKLQLLIYFYDCLSKIQFKNNLTHTHLCLHCVSAESDFQVELTAKYFPISQFTHRFRFNVWTYSLQLCSHTLPPVPRRWIKADVFCVSLLSVWCTNKLL